MINSKKSDKPLVLGDMIIEINITQKMVRFLRKDTKVIIRQTRINLWARVHILYLLNSINTKKEEKVIQMFQKMELFQNK